MEKFQTLGVGVFGGQFKVEGYITSGTFGNIFYGLNISTHQKIAIKLEKGRKSLINEYEVYKKLTGGVHVPCIYGHGKEHNYNYLAMDYLGPSLQSLFIECENKFSLKTILMLAKQMIDCIEFVHTKSFIHRDIKPDNFVMGHKNSTKVYIIDFGLAKPYFQNGVHIPFKKDVPFVGSRAFAATKTHIGYEQSRRTDLESLALTLIYFHRGCLPWEKVAAVNAKVRNSRMYVAKSTAHGLCENLPEEFGYFLNYTRKLKFEDSPDYSYLKSLFTGLFHRLNYLNDDEFDWNIQKQKEVSAEVDFLKEPIVQSKSNS